MTGKYLHKHGTITIQRTVSTRTGENKKEYTTTKPSPLHKLMITYKQLTNILPRRTPLPDDIEHSNLSQLPNAAST